MNKYFDSITTQQKNNLTRDEAEKMLLKQLDEARENFDKGISLQEFKARYHRG